MLLVIGQTWDGVAVREDEQVELELQLTSEALRLRIAAPYHNDPAPPAAPGSCAGLWEYEVVECFLVGDDERYLEIEVGPHGQYLLLSLRGRRKIVAQGMQAAYRAEIVAGRWSGELELARALVPEPLVRLNAFAVHGRSPNRRHLCWSALPAAAPDFHQIERFPLLGGSGIVTSG